MCVLSCTYPGNPVLSFQSFCTTRIGLPKGGSIILITKTTDQTSERDTLSLLVQFLLKPGEPCASLSASLIFSKLSESAVTEPIRFCLLSPSPSAQVSPVSHVASMTPLGIFALLRLPSALLDPVPLLTPLGSGPQHDTMVSLGCRVLWLRYWLLVGVAHLFASSNPPLIPLRNFPRSLSPLLSSLFSSSFSLPFPLPFSPHPCPYAYSHTRPPSWPHRRRCSRHRFLPTFPDPLFSPRHHMVGQAPGLAPEATGYLQAPFPVYRDEAVCGIAVPGLLLCFS